MTTNMWRVLFIVVVMVAIALTGSRVDGTQAQVHVRQALRRTQSSGKILLTSHDVMHQFSLIITFIIRKVWKGSPASSHL